jgi:hypothetical protein
MKARIVVAIAVLAAASIRAAQVEVSSNLDAPRSNETIEVKLKSAGSAIVRDAAGTEVQSQMIGDDTVIFQASFVPKETKKFTVMFVTDTTAIKDTPRKRPLAPARCAGSVKGKSLSIANRFQKTLS